VKRFLLNIWRDIWGGDPPTSFLAMLKRILAPPVDCTRCGGIGEEPGDIIACKRCGGNGLEPL
jgi:hypothetical protein